MTFDPSKPVQTRDGHKARVLCTDLDGPKPIGAGIYLSGGSMEFLYSYLSSGRLDDATPNGDDLVNAPEKRTVWINFYRTGATLYYTRKEADKYATLDRLSCIEVQGIDGEGLE